MPVIGVSDEVFDRVGLLAQAWEIPHGQVVARLLTEFKRSGRSRHEEADETGDGVAVHAFYQGTRIEARFDPASENLMVLTGPLAGQTFRTPSGAAGAIVVALNPSVKPNRNGWSFWTVSETGEILLAIRRR